MEHSKKEKVIEDGVYMLPSGHMIEVRNIDDPEFWKLSILDKMRWLKDHPPANDETA